ncbi:speckle-type poz protein [Anaeramoeba flamelloides]|uniref:Speckle-type poz protein n=1 Tax=Anaeramoeba flamelloides TaxID=1746091 RepID=A0AAV7Y7B4_9EUKA|nr:speckle-type poz protein [Anaeramoeba flamelloides]
MWENKMILISGYNYDNFLFFDDFWIFDFQTKTWQEVFLDKMSTNKKDVFSGRIRGKVTMVDNSLYYIGGYLGEYLLDVWEFKIKHTTLEKDLKNIYLNRNLCDWFVISKEKAKIEAHSSLLSARFYGTNPQIIKNVLSGRKKYIINNIILWCYTGKLDFKNLTDNDYQELDLISKKIIDDDKIITPNQKNNFFQNNLSVNNSTLLSTDIGKLFQDQTTTDFIILVKNEKIFVHKWVLIMRSELYRGMFNYVNTNIASVKDYSQKSFESVKALIEFFYTNNTAHIKSLEIAQELFDAIEYYGLNLKSEIGYYISNLLSINENNEN